MRWRYDETYSLIIAADGTEVGACHSNAANGRLMAAAPEMLRHIEKFVDGDVDWSPDFLDRWAQDAREILAAARGET